MNQVVVDPVLAAHSAALLGRHVTRDDEVTEGSVIVLQVLNDKLSFTIKLTSRQLFATHDSGI